MSRHSRSRHYGAFLLSAAAAVPAWPAEPDSPLEQVVITATPLRESMLETAQPVAVIGGDDLVRMRALSLGETLASQPGITATYFGPQASRPVIRGQGGERVQMYEDGGEALDVSALSGDHAVTIEPLMAERVEVVRGPATLLYGNSASSGLINVVTNRVPEFVPDDPVSGAFELRGNSALEERAGAGRLDGGSGSLAWHVDLHGVETDDISIPDFAESRALRALHEAEGEVEEAVSGTLPNSASESWGGGLGGSWIGERALLGLGVSRYATEYGIPGAHEEEEGGADEPAEEGGVHIDMAQTRYDLKSQVADPLRGIALARLRATYNEYEHREIEPSGETGTHFDQKGLDTRLVFDHDVVRGWRGTFGVQYRNVDFVALGEEAFVPPSETRNLGYFVFEERPFGPVTLEIGARLEQQRIEPDAGAAQPRYDDDSFSASTGALWKLTGAYALSLNVTSTQRHPTATELYANGPHLAAQRFEVGDSSLERERATTFDIGLRRTAGAWGMSLSAFRSDYSRYIFASPTALEEDGLPVFEYLQADADFTGLEAELRLPSADTPFGVVSTRLMGDSVRAELDDGRDLPQIPPLRIGGDVELLRGPFTAGLSVLYHGRQSRVAENELPTDSYILVGVDFSYRLPLGERAMLLFLRGENLLDEDARRHSSPLKDLAPLPGRAVAAGVRFEL